MYRVDRGGDITFHGPGQLVGYPIVSLGESRDLVGYVRALEAALIDAVGVYGVRGRTERGKTGVWVDLPGGAGEAKLAAIGVRISRGVSTHGFALNVTTDLSAFRRMIPCGFAHEAASLARLGVAVDIGALAHECAAALASRLGRPLVWNPPVAAPEESEIAADAPVRSARDLVAMAELEELTVS